MSDLAEVLERAKTQTVQEFLHGLSKRTLTSSFVPRWRPVKVNDSITGVYLGRVDREIQGRAATVHSFCLVSWANATFTQGKKEYNAHAGDTIEFTGQALDRMLLSVVAGQRMTIIYEGKEGRTNLYTVELFS